MSETPRPIGSPVTHAQWAFGGGTRREDGIHMADQQHIVVFGLRLVGDKDPRPDLLAEIDLLGVPTGVAIQAGENVGDLGHALTGLSATIDVDYATQFVQILFHLHRLISP